MKHRVDINLNGTIEVSYTTLQNIINLSMKAYIDSSKYMVSRREADNMFGETIINTLITNKLLKDIKGLGKTKCKFLVSDIITGIETLKNWAL